MAEHYEKSYIEDAVNYSRHKLKQVSKLMRQAGYTYSELRSINCDDMPHQRSSTNMVELRMVKRVDAQVELFQIKRAVELCTNRCKAILTALYFDATEPSNISVQISSGYGATQFSHYKKQALIQFTQAYRGY
ncbi:ArpU family phage packaging/lysis transcriptional regulator [Furfurilactobacillus entadae]|uniref:ArpU family phage packaging/lysis transcriptional regulator n=1 Tax=Furfurilactobacillus entadae TaxID=2922307 RepID=UPI0035EFD9B3